MSEAVSAAGLYHTLLLPRDYGLCAVMCGVLQQHLNLTHKAYNSIEQTGVRAPKQHTADEQQELCLAIPSAMHYRFCAQLSTVLLLSEIDYAIALKT